MSIQRCLSVSQLVDKAGNHLHNSLPQKISVLRCNSQPNICQVVDSEVVIAKVEIKKKLKVRQKKKKSILSANVVMTKYNIGIKNVIFLCFYELLLVVQGLVTDSRVYVIQ